MHGRTSVNKNNEINSIYLELAENEKTSKIGIAVSVNKHGSNKALRSNVHSRDIQ